MAELGEASHISIQQILERQGLGLDVSLMDVRFEEIRYTHIEEGKDRPDSDWYAIPTKIDVTNPLTREKERGALAQNGAFVADTARLVDGERGYARLKSRVLVLGKSVLSDAYIDEEVVVNSAKITRARVGTGSQIDEDTILSGDYRPGQEIKIGEEVSVGKHVSITGNTTIHDGCTVGSGVSIVSSMLGFEVVIEPTDDQDALPVDEMNQRHGRKTDINYSVVGDGVIVSPNVQIVSTSVGDGVLIGRNATLEHTKVTLNKTVPEGAKDIKKSPTELTVKIQDLERQLTWTTEPDKLPWGARQKVKKEIRALNEQLAQAVSNARAINREF